MDDRQKMVDEIIKDKLASFKKNKADHSHILLKSNAEPNSPTFTVNTLKDGIRS